MLSALVDGGLIYSTEMCGHYEGKSIRVEEMGGQMLETPCGVKARGAMCLLSSSIEKVTVAFVTFVDQL